MNPPVAMNARDGQSAGIPAPEGRLAGCVAEREGDSAGRAEDEEMRLVVVQLGVELLAEQQRDEAEEQGQRDREDARGTRGPCSSPVRGPAEGRLNGSVERNHAVSVGRAAGSAGSAERTILRPPRGGLCDGGL